MNKQVEFLVKLRDASQMLADATNEYIDSLAPPEVKGNKQNHRSSPRNKFQLPKI